MHEYYIQQCFNLAQKGLGKVLSNPLVGCVIVNNNTIIAEGYHQYYGGPHAEVDALQKINTTDLSNAILYVNLEPCAHQGKTHPCVNAIINSGIKKVVISNIDPNPLVQGKGIQLLQQAKIEVITGILEQQGLELNKRFFTFIKKQRPYIILKWAQTQDGFISKLPVPINKSENSISSKEHQIISHTWRSHEMAILVGYQTALLDNPNLTTRLVEGNNPIRVVIDKHNTLPKHLTIFNTESKTIVFNALINKTQNHIQFIKIDFDHLLEQLLHQLYKQNISSIIIEGGAKTLQQFINHNMWDEARVYKSETINFNVGIAAPVMNLNNSQIKQIEDGLLYNLHNLL